MLHSGGHPHGYAGLSFSAKVGRAHVSSSNRELSLNEGIALSPQRVGVRVNRQMVFCPGKHAGSLSLLSIAGTQLSRLGGVDHPFSAGGPFVVVVATRRPDVDNARHSRSL